MTSFYAVTRILMTVLAGALLAAVGPVTAEADGLTNCTEVTGSQVNRVGCYELVWVEGAEASMTFSNVQFRGNVPSDNLGVFYVIGPQDDTPQSEEASFVHDHTVGGTPRENHGTYSVHLHTFFAMCSAEGISSGACVPTFSELPGLGVIPLATTVNGQLLTSVEVIEEAARAGTVTLVDAGQVIVGTISGR